MESIREASVTLADRFYFSSRLILKYRPDRKTEKSSAYVDNAFKNSFWVILKFSIWKARAMS